MIVIYVISFIASLIISFAIIKGAVLSAIKTLIDDENFVKKLKKIVNEYE